MRQKIALLYIIALIQFLGIAVHAFPLVMPVGITIPRSEPGTSADLRSGEFLYIALSVTLSSSMILLLFIKWIYLAHRYQHVTYSSSSAFTGKADSSARGPLYSVSVDRLHQTKGMSGILVGLFGSPSWETKCSDFNEAASEFERVSFTRTRRSASSCSSHLIYCSREHQARTLSNGLSVNSVVPAQYGNDESQGKPLGIDERSRLVNGLKLPPLALITAAHPKDNRKGKRATTDTICRGISYIELPESALLSPLPYANLRMPAAAKAEASEPLSPQFNSFARSVSDSVVVDYGPIQKPSKPCYNVISQHNSLLVGCSSDQLPQQDTIPSDLIPREAALNIFICRSMKQQSENAANSPQLSTSAIHEASLTSQLLQQSRKLSPKAGPSPLRSMFLPNDKASPGSLKNQDSEPSSDSGYLFPIAPLTVKPMRPKKTCLVHKNQNIDSALYGLIQELVWETEAWDQSVFIDDKFKEMIDGSRQSTINDTHTTPTSRNTRSRHSHRSRQPLWNMLEDIPEIEECYNG